MIISMVSIALGFHAGLLIWRPDYHVIGESAAIFAGFKEG